MLSYANDSVISGEVCERAFLTTKMTIVMQIAALLFASERFLFSTLFKTETAKPS